jgi:hypothetical protein
VELRPLRGLARLWLQIPAPRFILSESEGCEVIAPLGSTCLTRVFAFRDFAPQVSVQVSVAKNAVSVRQPTSTLLPA